jgi:hypothetical protein
VAQRLGLGRLGALLADRGEPAVLLVVGGPDHPQEAFPSLGVANRRRIAAVPAVDERDRRGDRRDRFPGQ